MAKKSKVEGETKVFWENFGFTTMGKASPRQRTIQVKDTLLCKYIWTRYSSYEEPQRSGIQKGDPIGFSRKKYLTGLFVGLTNFSHKAIAQALGVSYGLVRKWLMAEDFQVKIAEHREGFTKSWINRLLERVRLQDKIPVGDFHEYDDSILYHPKLIDETWTEMGVWLLGKADSPDWWKQKGIGERFDSQKWKVFSEFLQVVLYGGYAGTLIKGIPWEEEQHRKLLKTIIPLLSLDEKFLLKAVLTKTERRLIVYHIKLARMALEGLVV